MLERKTVAINLSDSSVEALELLREKGSLRIKSQSRILLESGIIEDGKIIDQEKLRTAVKLLLAQAKPTPITAHEVVITLPESRVYCETIRLGAKVPKKQVAAALFSQAIETIPLDAKIMAADFTEVRTVGDMKDYLFVATNAPLLQEYVTLFQSLSLKVSLVTMESLALAMAVIDESVEETVLLLDIGARTTIASIIQNGDLQESININIAGNNITAALAEKLKISPAEAEQRKMMSGLHASGNGDGTEMLIIQGQVQPLKDELLVFIKFYERKTGTAINRVLLAGGTASLVGLDEYFSSNLGLPTSKAVPSPLFKIEAQEWYAPTFLNVLGLARIALGERTGTINFLTHREKDWIPDVKGIPAAVQSAHQQESAPVVKTRSRRTMVLVIVLILMLNVFGWLAWWKYGASLVPVGDSGSVTDVSAVPSAPAPVADALSTVSFTFSVGLSPEAVTAGGIAGKREKIALSQTMPIDASTMDIVKKSLFETDPNHAEPSAAALDEGLKNYLAGQLWSQNVQTESAQRDKEGVVLLATYMDAAINSAEPLKSPGSESVTSMKMNVEYTGMVITDRTRFAAVEGDALQAFLQSNPGATLQTREFSYIPEANGLVKVISLYTFSLKK